MKTLTLLLTIAATSLHAGTFRCINASSNFCVAFFTGAPGISNAFQMLIPANYGPNQIGQPTTLFTFDLESIVTNATIFPVSLTVLRSDGTTGSVVNLYNAANASGYDMRGDAVLTMICSYNSVGSVPHQAFWYAYKPPTNLGVFSLDYTESFVWFFSGWGLVMSWYGLGLLLRIIRKNTHTAMGGSE